MSAASRDRICVARIGGAHGVRGDVKLWAFTQDALAVADYGPLAAPDGRIFEIEALRAAKDHLVVHLKGVDSREDAERLRGVELHVARERLPATQDGEYYHADLIGLEAESPQGAPIGTIVAVHNFGAGDIIEVAPAAGGPTLLLPFSNAVVPTIDLAAGRAILDLPAESGDADPETDPDN